MDGSTFVSQDQAFVPYFDEWSCNYGMNLNYTEVCLARLKLNDIIPVCLTSS